MERVGGGDINDAYKVQFADESFAFVKTRADVAPGEYAAEATGLRWLAEPGGLRVPEVLGASDEVLVLDWVDEGGRGDAAAFGAGLATVHAAGAPDFGGPEPLRLGSLTLPNDPAPDWPTFYAAAAAAPAAAARGTLRGRQPRGRAGVRADARARRTARAARAPARRPLERQRAVGPRRARVADRPRGLRRPSRGRPRDAAAVRLARRALPPGLRGAPPARRGPPGARRALPAVPAARARCAVRRRLSRLGRARGAHATPRECRRRCS